MRGVGKTAGKMIGSCAGGCMRGLLQTFRISARREGPPEQKFRPCVFPTQAVCHREDIPSMPTIVPTDMIAKESEEREKDDRLNDSKANRGASSDHKPGQFAKLFGDVANTTAQ